MRNIYFIKSCEEYVSHTFKKNLFKMKNSKNDFPLVWSKTKAPTASLPVVMTLRWQTAGRWGSWGRSHTCTTSLGNSWVWSWRLALFSVWCETSSQAGGLHICTEDSKCFQIGKWDCARVAVPGFVNFFPGWRDWRSLSSASPSSMPKSLLSVQSFVCQAGVP